MYDAAFAALEILRSFRNDPELHMSKLMKNVFANAGLTLPSYSQEDMDETPVDQVIAAATGEEDVLAEDVATIEEEAEALEDESL